MTAQFRHLAVFYETDQDYLDQVGRFVRGGLAAREPVLVAVPAARLRLLRRALNGAADGVTFTDMQQLGRNPSRIIPAVRRFTDAHPGRTRFVGEPIWAGRTEAETREVACHEALVNAAFAGVPATLVCPYDRAGLDGRALGQACQAHPQIAADGKSWPSQAYCGIDLALAIAAEPQPPAPADAAVLSYQRGNLAQVRRFTGEHASRAGLADQGRDDLVIAVNELAANSIAHAHGYGTLRIWTERGQLICEITDTGHIGDPLAGRRLATAEEGGHGLRVVHQVCDLVEMRSGSFGTNIRVYRDLNQPARAALRRLPAGRREGPGHGLRRPQRPRLLLRRCRLGAGPGWSASASAVSRSSIGPTRSPSWAR
jgi:anti-sigma regulatory factor (Ser/Thr protein kinase)